MSALKNMDIISCLRGSRVISADSRITQVLDQSNSNQNKIIFCSSSTGDFVVKIFAQKNMDRCEKEVSALRFCSDLGLPVPTVLEHGLISRDANAFGYIIMTKLQGSSLEDDITALDTGTIDALSDQIAQLLKTQRSANKSMPHDEASITGGLRDRFQRLSAPPQLSKLSAVGLTGAHFRHFLKKCAEQPQPGTSHGVTHDWRLRHIFAKAGRITGLLDMEYFKNNDFAAEIAHFLHDLSANGTEQAKRIGSNLLDALPSIAPDDPEMIRRIPLWMTKQAISSILSKLERGTPDKEVLAEAKLAIYYADLDSCNLKKFFKP